MLKKIGGGFLSTIAIALSYITIYGANYLSFLSDNITKLISE